MIELFIPVLFMCISNDCNFMQSQVSFKTEASCKVSVEGQIAHMIEIAKDSKQGDFTVLEGTCVSIKVDTPRYKTI